MSEENKNVYEAKKSLKANIKLFEDLLKHVNGTDEVIKARAMWATWCLHRYINDRIIVDIEMAMREYGTKEKQ